MRVNVVKLGFDNNHPFFAPDNGTAIEGFPGSTIDKTDSAVFDFQKIDEAYKMLKGLDADISQAITSFSSVELMEGISDDGSYADALKCVNDKGGLSGGTAAALERARNVRKALLEAQGLSEELFDNEDEEDDFGNDLDSANDYDYDLTELEGRVIQLDHEKDDLLLELAEMEKEPDVKVEYQRGPDGKYYPVPVPGRDQDKIDAYRERIKDIDEEKSMYYGLMDQAKEASNASPNNTYSSGGSPGPIASGSAPASPSVPSTPTDGGSGPAGPSVPSSYNNKDDDKEDS